MCGLIESSCLPFQRTRQRPTPARKSGAYAYMPVGYEMNEMMNPLPAEQPPSYQDATATGECVVILWFGSDAELLRKEGHIDKANGYSAHLLLKTTDIVGLMRDGLDLTPENIKVEENHLERRYEEQEQRWYWYRHYTLVDPRYSGFLTVRAWDRKVTSKFRVDDLSADKVYLAVVGNKSEDFVYHFDLFHPEVNANYIFDDMPMEGLWPYPRKDDVKKNGKE
ncbi:hypothetical protein ACHAPJ_000844 [Fusarium lateritium]